MTFDFVVGHVSTVNAAITSLNYAEEGVLRLSSALDQLLTLARVEGRVRFDDGVSGW